MKEMREGWKALNRKAKNEAGGLVPLTVVNKAADNTVRKMAESRDTPSPPPRVLASKDQKMQSLFEKELRNAWNKMSRTNKFKLDLGLLDKRAMIYNAKNRAKRTYILNVAREHARKRYPPPVAKLYEAAFAKHWDSTPANTKTMIHTKDFQRKILELVKPR
jgi:hypothetical protein